MLTLIAALGANARADLEAGLDAVKRKDYPSAFAEFRSLAEKGDADAQVDLGNLFMRGLGLKQDYATAFDWYQRAANQNHPIGQSKLGIMHYYGLGTVQDSEAAAKWFRKAADQGVASAQSVLGTLYAQGDGVMRNPVEAFFWLTLAFEFGDRDAITVREQLSGEMSPGEIAEALGKVEAWNRERGIPDPGAVPAGEPGPVEAGSEQGMKPPGGSVKSGTARKRGRSQR